MWTLLLSTFFINLFGIFNLFGISKSLMTIQIIYYSIGLLAFFIVKKIGLQFFKNNSKFFYWLFISLMVLTYIIGVEANGSKRWINLYFFNFQPSEFFKIFFIIFLADFFTRHRKDIDEIYVFLASLIYFLIPVFIIFKQPDLANAVVYVFIYFIMLIFSKIPKRYIIYLAIVILLITPLGWAILKDYQRLRILSFLNPHLDQAGTGYNITQAVITVGSGKFFGRGLGLGTQSKLLFLPENHTDFAFSSLVEQFGFLGGFLVLFFYFIIGRRIAKRMIKYHSMNEEEGIFKYFFSLGLFAYFIFQVMVNVGMNLGLLPVAGVALPLISYGGSSLVSFMIGLGLIP